MTAPLRKGWCPGALRPMMAKDGLLVRLRVTGGVLPARTAFALADLAERYGSGLFDLSARGNLQMRGVTDAALKSLQDGLRTVGLLDETSDAEAVRNVIASPLAGLHDGIDIRPLTTALEHRLTSDKELYALPTKFGFLVDDGSAPSLAGISADVRFDWSTASARFSIGLGGTRNDAVRVGACLPNDLVRSAARIARGAMALFAMHPDARRLRDLVAIAGADAVAATCGGDVTETLPVAIDSRVRDVVGWHGSTAPRCGTVERGDDLGLAVPFGRLDSAMLRAAADMAADSPCGELRLTPWRVILVPGAPSREPPTGFIADASDPRLAVVACVGADGCAQGTTNTHHDAGALAAHLGVARAEGVVVHVSGCSKGCAKASRTPVTLVARDGSYDLVRDGRAADAAVRRGLDTTAATHALAEALMTPA